MTYYSRFRMLAESSDTDDYAQAHSMEVVDTDSTSTQRRFDDVFEVDTTTTTYSLAHLATCKWLTIANPSTNSYKVTFTIKTNANSGTGFLVDIDPGESIKLVDLYATGGAVANLTATSTTSAQKVLVSFEGT